MGVAVGIDLGTSNSCVAVVRNGEPIVLTDAEGRRTQPSVVAFGHGGHTLVGHRARKQLLYAPENTVVSVKRLIGGRYSSPDVQRLKALAAYGIAEGEHDTVRVRVQGKLYTPEEISSRVLAHMKQIAEAALGEEVDKAVVTVPAYFNDAQRQATRDAAALAGLECLRILNEPTAAALAYGYQKGRRQHVVVYDLGGGTFDVSVLRIDEDFFEVVATAGDTFLGGDDFDEAVAAKFLEVLESQLGHSVHENRSTRLRLREAAERAKIALCDEDSVRVEVPAAWRSPTGEELDFVGEIDRYHYAMTVMPLVKRTIEVCEMAMHTAMLTPRQIDAVLLVGGMTRYPLVHDAVRQHFGLLPNNSVNPDEVVAIGAAIQAYTLTATDDVALDPAVLLDVTPRTLAVGTLGGLVEPVVKLNTPVPTEATKTFVTANDGQTEVRVAVFQGESRRQDENTLIGELVLDGLVPAPRGAVRVDVTFEIDVDGILRVRALDRSTDNEQTIRIESAASMTPDEMERARARVGELNQALATEE